MSFLITQHIVLRLIYILAKAENSMFFYFVRQEKHKLDKVAFRGKNGQHFCGNCLRTIKAVQCIISAICLKPLNWIETK